MFPATVTRPSFMNLLRNFYRLAAPFWLTRQSWKAWLALGSAIACSLLFVQVVVLVARWQKAFFDALSNFGAKEIPQLLLEYLLYLAAMTALIVILKTVESTLSQIRRRRARGTSGLWPSSP